MKNMTLKKITAACGGTYMGDLEAQNLEITGVAIDSRKIKPGFLFIPIKGARVDGHDYIESVIASGAFATLSENNLGPVSFPYILVESCTQAIKDIAEFYRISLDIKVIGVTGSVGKTSTKEMIASVLSEKFNVLKTSGNYNNEIGLPLTIFNITAEHDVAVLEMGISDFHEMSRLSKIARPDVCVITNIGLCHLENLKTREGVLKAKSEIFEYMNPNGAIILNGEDAMLRTISQVNNITPQFFGLSPETETYADEIKTLGLKGTSCCIHFLDAEAIAPTIKIPGSHMVLNALAGACVGHYLGLSGAEICSGIESLTPVEGRNNLIETSSLSIIDDCYNANPVSMNASLDVLSQATTRTVAILGDMGELGENEDELHYGVGIHAAYNKIDLICCIGELSLQTYAGAQKTISRDVELRNCQILYFDNKEKFIDSIDKILKKGDTVLVKASHFMDFTRIVHALKETVL